MRTRKNIEVEVHPCAGCHYWRSCGVENCCHYILVVGHSRGCPPGSECTKKIPPSAELLKQEHADLIRKISLQRFFAENERQRDSVYFNNRTVYDE